MHCIIPHPLSTTAAPCHPLRAHEGVEAIGTVVKRVKGPRLPARRVQWPQLAHKVPAPKPVAGRLQVETDLGHAGGGAGDIEFQCKAMTQPLCLVCNAWMLYIKWSN